MPGARKVRGMKIAFIGFGEAARAFASSLSKVNGPSMAAFDILTARGGDQDVRQAAGGLGVEVSPSPAAAVDGADWVFSAVTAADSLDAGLSVQGLLSREQVFIDINSVSAGRKVETARAVCDNGAAYVDMAVMAPVHPRLHRTPVLLAGPACAELAPTFGELDFDFSIVGDEIGAATSIKMLRSLFVKGLEAVAVQTLLAASAAGRYDEVYASLSKSFPQLGWPDFAVYQLERVTRHGVRRAAEMTESAATLDELGFPAGGDLARAIAALQREIGTLGARIGNDAQAAEAYGEVLTRLDARL